MTTKIYNSGSADIMIREWRSARGKTLQNVQEQTNIDQSMLSKIENGQRRWNRDHIIAIAAALDVEPFQLFISPDDQVLRLIAKLESFQPHKFHRH